MTITAWDNAKVLRLPYECLETLPGGLREVRVWHDTLTDQLVVGKRLDLPMVGSDVLVAWTVLTFQQPQIRTSTFAPVAHISLLDTTTAGSPVIHLDTNCPG